MLSIEQAIRSLQELLNRIEGTETLPLEEALGRTPARSIAAPIDLPPYRSSAMDGYVLCGPPTIEPGFRFYVCGESRAGHPYSFPLGAGQACRVFTGSVIPENATAVVIQEEVKHDKSYIVVLKEVQANDNIRDQGTDISKGQPLTLGFEPLSPYTISWMAACGIEEVEVVRKVKVAVFCTGDELQDPGNPLGNGEIYDSNRIALKLLLRRKSVDLIDLGKLADDYDQIKAKIESVGDDVDLIITSGGVSVGDADLVRPVIENIGTLEFWNIAIKPGKPFAVGRLNNTVFFGLPGNPVSTIVTFLLFVEPAIDALTGLPWPSPARIRAELVGHIRHRSGRAEFQRGYFVHDSEGLKVKPTGDQGSHRIGSFSQCNCLIVIPAHRDDLHIGETVTLYLLSGSRNLV